jgi:large subunit ribosomal protein L30
VSRLQITLKRSAIGYEKGQRLTLKALGLRLLNSTVIHGDSRVVRGMVNKVRHLVHVEELPEE